MASHKAAVSALVATMVVASALAGCTARESTASTTPVSGLNLDAEVDPATGRIILPADRFGITEEEMAVLSVASTMALADCARADGVDFAVSTKNPYSPLYDVSMRWGVWVDTYAERFGFVPPMTDADLRANEVVGAPTGQAPDSAEQPDLSENSAIADHNSTLTSADQAVLDRCSSSKATRALNPAALVVKGPWTAKLNDVSTAFDSLDEVKDVYSEYRDCLAADGLRLSTDDGPGSPDAVIGADPSTISEEQISLALRVVACKTTVNLVPRLATIMAAQQAPIIEEYGAELVKQREAIDRAVTDARALISVGAAS